MFKFLKDKLSKGIKKLSKGIEDEGTEEVVEQEVQQPVEEETPPAPPPEKKEAELPRSKPEPKAEAPVKKQATPKKPDIADKQAVSPPPKEEKQPVGESPKEHKGFLRRIFSKKEEEAPTEEKEKPVPVEKKAAQETKPAADEEAPSKDEALEKKEVSPQIPEKAAKKPLEEQKPVSHKPQSVAKEEERPSSQPAPKKEEPPQEQKVGKRQEPPSPEKKSPARPSHSPEEAEEQRPPAPIDAPAPEQPPAQSAPEENAESAPLEHPEQTPKKKGIFSRIKERVVTTKISAEKFDELFWELELALLEANAAVQVIEKIKADLKKSIVDEPIRRGKVEETILGALKASIDDLLTFPRIDLIERSDEKKPFIVAFVGINGSGKTTTIAKVASLLKAEGKSVLLAAADTFRAAAIDQLQHHADKLDVRLVKHDYGSDPAAVAFDAVKLAKHKDIDVVLIDTAGRLHSATNLVEEMKKIIRVAQPDLKVFVGESITGNDCVEQAERFDEAINLDGIILSKADVDEKGGAALSVAHITGKPILYIGTGQEYSDLKPFDKAEMLRNLGFT